MHGCLDEDRVLDLLEGRLDDGARAEVTQHLDVCGDCRRLVAAAALASPNAEGAPADEASRPATLQSGAEVGRYVIVDLLGAGSMGVVYSAYDPELRRKVALKLLRGDGRGGNAHLVREARALAQLAHPNVITVHDVGTFEGAVFIAMELVEGKTLRAWLRLANASATEMLEAFLQAGEGLAAAHAVGLIHRDFKPDNVLVGDDGRVRVTDFGLARGPGPAARGTSPETTHPHRDETLTKTGEVLGTPAYMAPEQLAGGVADARSDLFAFCVALYEALYGERPFAATDLSSLENAITTGAIRAAPARSRVAMRTRRILLRGLRADPAERPRSMRALLDALRARGPVTPARILGATVVSLSVLAVVLYTRDRPQACSGGEEAWGPVWDAEQRARTLGAFRAVDETGGPAAFARADAAIGAYRDSFVALHGEACAATRLRGEQSEALLDLRMRCLADRRRSAAAVTTLLEAGGAEAMLRAPEVVAALPSLAECSNATALGAQFPLPEDPATRARIEALMARAAESRALQIVYMSDPKRSLDIAEQALEEARALGYAPLVATLLLARALATRSPERSARLHDAAMAAIAAHDDGAAADAWTALAWGEGFVEAHADLGEMWSRYAAAAIERLGGDDEREAERLYGRGVTMMAREGRAEESLPVLARARALFVARRGPEHFRIASIDTAVANYLLATGHPAEALALHRQTEVLRTKLFGPDSQWVEVALVNECEDLVRLERLDEALGVAHALLAKNPNHDGALWLVALALRRRGDFEGALASDRASVAAFERAKLHGTPYEALVGQGEDLLALERAAEAIAPLETVVARADERDISEFDSSRARLALARALWSTGGDRRRARALAERAKEVLAPLVPKRGVWWAELLADIERWLDGHAL